MKNRVHLGSFFHDSCGRICTRDSAASADESREFGEVNEAKESTAGIFFCE